MWGPFQVEPRLYYQALNQIAELNSGRVRYKANDSFRKTNRVSNCIHAVGAVSHGHRVRIASPGWGDTASYALTISFLPYVVDGGRPHYWVSSAMGLDRYPIAYRQTPTRRRVPFTGLLIPDPRPVATYGPPCHASP